MKISLDSSEWTLERIKAVADFAREIFPDRDLMWASDERFLEWFENQGTVTSVVVSGEPQSDFLKRDGTTTVCGIILARAVADDGSPLQWPQPLSLFGTVRI